MPSGCRWSSPRRSCFNEAGAKRPRNFAVPVHALVDHVLASMRPGRRGPGIILVQEAHSAAVHASMRPGRRGPGIAVLAAIHARCISASMRPGRRGPGIRRCRLRTAHCCRASMRPGRRGPGIHGWDNCQSRCLHASMRPGRRGPGIHERAGVPRREHEASMRPGRRGPGICPPCNLLWLGTEFVCFRAAPDETRRAQHRGRGRTLHDIKEPSGISMKCRIERPPVKPRCPTARITSAERARGLPCVLDDWCDHITTACLSMALKDLPMLSTTSAVRSAGPTSISKT